MRGKSPKYAADALKRSTISVRHKARRLGLQFATNHWTPREEATVRAGIAAGRTFGSIAAEINRTRRSVISYARHKLGLNVRETGRVWTPEEDIKLRALATARYSATKIARELERTPNSVIGRCHRHGIYLNSTGYYQRTPAKKLPVPTNGAAPPFVSLFDLTPSNCRWVERTPREVPDAIALFCGRKSASGYNYCAEHAVRVYQVRE